MLQALRSFFKWTTRENHTLFNPASELELPRIPKLLPRSILTVEEVAAILNETDIDSVYGLRDRAMLELLYSTALRRQEVANLIYSDIDFKRQVVFVRGGKGGHDRVAPIGERACAWLEKYLADAREQLATVQTNALFLTDYGDPVSGYYVTARVKRYMALAGIERVGAAHLLRHACATHMLEGGADIRFIQALLGHANLNTTEIYTHVSIEKLKAIHAATHPARITRLQGAAKAQGQVAAPDPATALLAALQAESSEEESDGAPT
jgi:integrase/recombinase XerD